MKGKGHGEQADEERSKMKRTKSVCTDAVGGSRDLSNGRRAENQWSDLHGTSCYQRREFIHALTSYYWLRTVRVHTCVCV